jgi:hypothetical protein
MRRLNAKPRELSVLYYSGEGVPCPCSVDGVMLAVSASPGQGSVRSLRKSRRPARSRLSWCGRAEAATG